ncbi:chaplin [Streptomyces sp. KLOTTS4A1]|uniref:chaplin n=1 Tax=Streptomyces sp. KLOTTS4A1 TaxID=3390996 RepID=UPI0039F5DAC8
MRQVTRKGLITVAAASGVLAVTGGAAFADSQAEGSTAGSPGVLSGNTVEAPVHVPVNVCGNTVDVVGLLNPASGNSCANVSDGGGSSHSGGGSDSADSTGYGDSGSGSGSGTHGGNGTGGGGDTAGYGTAGGGAEADGTAEGSPGILSGNTVQAPVDLSLNVCGNSATVGGLGNATEGNDCVNGEVPPAPEEPPVVPETPDEPNVPQPHTGTPPPGTQRLAQTGTDFPVGIAAPVGAGLLLAGAVLYRRARAAA